MTVKPLLPISLVFCSLLLASCNKKKEESKESVDTPKVEEAQASSTEDALAERRVATPQIPEIKDELPEHQLFIKPTRDPEEFLSNFIDILQSDLPEADVQLALEKHANHKLSPNQLAQISDLKSVLQHSKKTTPSSIEKVGDIKANQLSRWALKRDEMAPILIDVKRQGKNSWSIDQIAIPQVSQANGNVDSPAGSSSSDSSSGTDNGQLEKDALNFSYFFLQALLKQDFKLAKSMVDTSNITDATLAGLCIIFDEAAYKIDKTKPLRTLFVRDTAAGFYANVISSEGSKAAHFSILTQREQAEAKWKIYEINLNELLSDYTKRMAGGDSYFTPIVKNPQGGDTLVIYFDFDSSEITPRMDKQLKIVTALLKLDPNKKITLSGHTDSKGLSGYNLGLSEQRANKVKEFLSNNGVDSAQIITKSLGATVPRAPNTYSDGSDNPDGRRANRRTEIYLDF